MTDRDNVLATDIDKHQEAFGIAFNSGDVDAVNSMYVDGAVSVWEPGNPHYGEARREYVANFLRTRKPTVDAKVRQQLVVGDTAMLVVEWEMQALDENGEPEHLEGVAIDVLRRGDDGFWRYVVDNPFGVSGPWTADEAATAGKV
ncbi:YybH family protein [Actinokineospora iranica]|uniref:Ketosteroid isomerase homolog n=1 Tax=Actinokineospora iranica TaxID=1271860 RepID=A0A1G6S929_9PSEU|nr:nuclear transport factor 2 family protein [Actinokineospora iranica]SDD13171.1 Ketosteroid isomerase homolog [Actinokineospora iranica]